MPPATLTQSMAQTSLGTAATARGLTGTDDFAQLLALQMSQASQASSLLGLGETGADQASDPFAALLPAGLGQANSGMDGLLTLRLLEVVERLLDYVPAAAATPPTGLPVSGPISQAYQAGHGGVDVAVPVGTPVQATLAGKVTYAGWNDEGYGNLVIVENGPYQTYYAHLQSIPVTVGQSVAAGTVVGLSGNTGNSTGPHLHYEVRVDGQTVAPA